MEWVRSSFTPSACAWGIYLQLRPRGIPRARFEIAVSFPKQCPASEAWGFSRVDGHCSEMERALCIIDGDLGRSENLRDRGSMT